MTVKIPSSGSVSLTVEKKDVRLTNLDKPFWPELGITKDHRVNTTDSSRPYYGEALASMRMERMPDLGPTRRLVGHRCSGR